MNEEREEKAVEEIKKLIEQLGDKATIAEDGDALKITIEGDWTSGHPTKRPRQCYSFISCTM